MKKKTGKMYARISDYGDIVIPMSLLESIVRDGYVVNTSYENGTDVVNKVRKIDRVSFHTEEELELAMAQQALEE